MTVAVEVSGSQTASISTEHTLAETGGSNDLPAGQVYVLAVDLANLASGDVVELRIYTKARAADSVRQYDVQTFEDAQTSPGVQSIPVPTGAYTKVTLKQTAGTGRAFPWAVYRL